MAARPVMTLSDVVEIDAAPDEIFAALSEPERALALFGSDQASLRRLPHAHRWVLSHPGRLGDRVIDLARLGVDPPRSVAWRATVNGYRAESELAVTPHGEGGARLTVDTSVFAVSLTARLSAPLARLAAPRAREGLGKALIRLKRGFERRSAEA